MRIVVTGGSGYIGSRIIKLLAGCEQTDEIVNIDINPPKEPHPSNVRFVQRSVTEDLADLFTNSIDAALHLAWTVEPMRDEDKQRDICIGGTQRFLDGCAAGDVRHVLFMSSGTAYGANDAHRVPVDESTPLKRQFHFQYSAEKREAEEICRRFATDRSGTLLQIVRPCVVGGPNVSNYIFRSIYKPINFRAIGRDSMVQLVHEDDCAAATVAILNSKLPGAFNVAAEGLLSMRELYQRLGVRSIPLPVGLMRSIVDVAWKKGWTQVTEAPADFLYFIFYPWLVSNRRLKEEVGFRFRYTAEETVEAFLASQ